MAHESHNSSPRTRCFRRSLAVTHNPTRILPTDLEGTGSSSVLVQVIHETATLVHDPPAALVGQPQRTPTPETLSIAVGPEQLAPAAGTHAFPPCDLNKFDVKRRAVYASFPHLRAAGVLPAAAVQVLRLPVGAGDPQDVRNILGQLVPGAGVSVGRGGGTHG